MKKDLYLKYRKYENWMLLILFLGPMISAVIGIVLVLYVNIWFGLIVCSLLSYIVFRITDKLDDKATKYMLDSYDKGDDPYYYVKHLTGF